PLDIVVSMRYTETRSAQLTCSAANANGARIVKDLYLKGNAHRQHRLKIVVTVKHRLGRLIHGARVSVSSTKRGRLARRPHATSTGPRGKVTLGRGLARPLLGKGPVVRGVARRPLARPGRRGGRRRPR